MKIRLVFKADGNTDPGEDVKAKLAKWVRQDGSVVVEFDTARESAEVEPQR